MVRGNGALAVVLMALAACGGGTTEPAPTATTLALVSGGGQTGPAGQALPQALVVKATTSAGAGVAGVSVTFAVTAGGGTLSAASVTTDAQGQATTTWTLGTAAGGAQTVTATSGGLTGSPLTFSATAVAGPAAALSIASGNNQVGAPSQPLSQLVVARVADAFANPVSGVPVQWQVTSGGGSVAQPSTVTTAGGTASVAWTLGGAIGAQAMQAAVAGVATPLPFAATAINLVITTIAPDPMVEGQAATITGQGFDPAPGATTVTVGGGAAAITAISPTSITFTVPSDCRPARDATVEVRVGGVAVSATKPVRPAAFLDLAVGEQRIISAPTDLCLQFERKAAAEGYLIGVQSLFESAASLTPVVFTSEVAPGAAPAPPLPQPVRAAAARAFSPGETERQRRFAAHREAEGRIRALERRTFPDILPRPTADAARVSSIPPNLNVGDVIPIRVPNIASGSLCNFIEIQAVVRAIGTRGVWLEDQANPANGYSTANFQSLSAQLDNPIYDVDVAYFGDPTDLDGNTRIGIVITKEVNKFQASVGFVLGFVTDADLVDRSQCASSDFGELFYGIAPDPTGSFGGQYPVATALEDAPFVIAHELTHIIQFGRRLGTPFLSQWESEGQATLAEEVVGHAVEGRGTGQNLGLGVAFNLDDPSSIDWYADGFIDLAQYFGFETQTTKVTGAPEQCTFLAGPPSNGGPCVGNRQVYGVPWSLLRWIADQFGPGFPGGEQALFRSMVNGTDAGFANLVRVTGVPIETMLAQWAAMLYVDDRFPGMAARLTLTSWNMFDIYEGTFQGARLFETTRLVPRERGFVSYTDNISVRGASSSYHRVSSATRAATAIKVRGSNNSMLPAGMQVWVVRTQ